MSNIKNSKLANDSIVGNGFIDFVIIKNPLVTGEYLFTAAIFNWECITPYDFKDRLFRFKIISTEENSVVSWRAKKMKIPVKQGVSTKETVLKSLIELQKINPEKIIYMGNDVNDLECMKIAGISVSPCDAHPEILKMATIVLSRAGGNGAVRELVDYIIEKFKQGDVN